MKFNFKATGINTEVAQIEELNVNVEYTVEEMIKLLEIYPEFIAQLMKAFKGE